MLPYKYIKNILKETNVVCFLYCIALYLEIEQ